MKKFLALLLAAIMMMGLVTVASADTAEDEIYIGILAPVATHGWVAAVAYHAQEAAEESGVKYTVITAENADEMSNAIEQFITLGVDAIVVWPQFTGVATAAEKALDAGIIIYNFDMVIDVSEEYVDHENFYVLTGDNYGIGVSGAQYIVDKIGTEGTVLVLDNPGSGPVAAARIAGFNDTIATLAPDLNLEVIATTYSSAEALVDVTDALTTYDHIDAILSLDDESSMGALQAIKETQRTDIKAITGGGGCQDYFKMMTSEEYEGISIASALYAPTMITLCVENTVKILQGEEVEHTITIPSQIVDAENVADYLDENSLY